MSPTIIRERGYRVVIFFNDHTPAHVHVIKAEGEARVGLEPVHILSSRGYSNQEQRVILEIVHKHQQHLLDVWDTYHEQR